MKKYTLINFSKFDAVPAFVKTEVGRRFVVNNDFVELDKMQVNFQGVEHDLQRIEQIDSRSGTRGCIIAKIHSV